MITTAPKWLSDLNIDGLSMTTSTDFGSAQPRHRENLRHAAASHLASHTAADLSSLADLGAVPRLPGWALSLSHCPTLGGFVVAPGSFGLGLDIEQRARVTPQAAARVATTALEKCLVVSIHPASFWVAKESAIKAFGNFCGVDLHYGIVEITSFSDEGYFTARWNQHEAQGVSTTEPALAFAVTRTVEHK